MCVYVITHATTRHMLQLGECSHRRVVLSLSAGVRLGKALQGEEVLAPLQPGPSQFPKSL
eukprot:4854986-Amphidinium_carterae.1